MNKKRGFTLIELLAVIVILAVIALIATPIIMNVIDDSKKGAAKDAMYGYVKAVELAATKKVTSTTDAPSGTYTTKDGNLYNGDTKILDITFKGTKPKDVTGVVKLASGNVTSATLEFDGIPVTYNGKKAEVGGSSTPTPSQPSKTYTIGEVVYFDPTGAITDCASGKEWTASNTSTTCYKWNVIKDNGNNIEMLLDHNTTAMIAWVSKEDYIAFGETEAQYSSYGNNKYGPVTVMKQLKTDTNGWSRVETLTSSDNVTRANGWSGTYTIDYNGMKARLISGQELADIVGNTTWTTGNDTSISLSSASWLYQNTYGNGDDSNYGYWTDTARPSYYNHVWNVGYSNLNGGRLNRNYPSTASGYGVRPAVRVLKSNI